MIACATAAAAGSSGQPEPAAPGAVSPATTQAGTVSPVVFPHPLITEVLYAVPGGDKGDADGDGVRSATGDEFIELVNPHDKPIELQGYVITDAEPVPKPGEPAPNKDSDNRLRFVFPKLTLQPGEVVVVFNGFESKAKGPIGDSRAAAKAVNPAFHGAWVFSMKAESKYAALGNSGDCVQVLSSDGTAIQCVKWAEIEEKMPKETAAVVDIAPESKGSVQRSSATEPFVAHRTLAGPHAGELFSPGRFGEKRIEKP